MSEYPTFCIDYEFAGSKWALNIHAKDEAEVSRRLRAIGMTGQVLGELVGTVEAGEAPPARSKWAVRLRLLAAVFQPITLSKA